MFKWSFTFNTLLFISIPISGHQLMAKAFGGVISRNANEKFVFGSEKINIAPELSEQKFYKKVFGETDYYTIMESHGKNRGAGTVQ